MKKTISIIGLGYVGLPLALLVDKKGYIVRGIDIDTRKIDLLKKKISPFKDERIAKDLKKTKINFVNTFAEVKNSDIIVICVPTPVHENYMPDLKPIEDTCKSIAPFIKKGQLVILESTVNPGVCEGIILPILERETKMKAGKDFYLAHCPERINPGDTKWSVENIPRVVGSLEAKGLKIATEFYRSIISGEIKPMGTIKEAESVKVVENCFRDVNIAFVNELAMSFSKLGINIVNVIEGCATKPFAFMAHYPGCGVGGHCIPVDPYYLIEYAKENGFEHDFLKLARNVNNGMPGFTVDLLIESLKEIKLDIKKTKVAVLGLSYKANIDDCRESPAFKIIKHLEKKGAQIHTFDPFVLEKSNTKTLKDALNDAQAVILVTAHTEFKKISPQMLKKAGIKIVIDGRNCLPKEKIKEAGIIYKGIGI
jgi:nucleotide sugar dehydrogenase